MSTSMVKKQPRPLSIFSKYVQILGHYPYASLIPKTCHPPRMHITAQQQQLYIQWFVTQHTITNLPQFTHLLRLTHILRTMWTHSKNYIANYLEHIRTTRFKVPGNSAILLHHRLVTLEYYNYPRKKTYPYKNEIFFDLLLLHIFHDIDTWHLGLEHQDKLNQVMKWLTERIPIIRASHTYDLKYVPFGFYAHYYYIEYTWVDRNCGTHKISKKPVCRKTGYLSPTTRR